MCPGATYVVLESIYEQYRHDPRPLARELCRLRRAVWDAWVGYQEGADVPESEMNALLNYIEANFEIIKKEQSECLSWNEIPKHFFELRPLT
jgi:hypothetical protein